MRIKIMQIFKFHKFLTKINKCVRMNNTRRPGWGVFSACGTLAITLSALAAGYCTSSLAEVILALARWALVRVRQHADSVVEVMPSKVGPQRQCKITCEFKMMRSSNKSADGHNNGSGRPWQHQRCSTADVTERRPWM
jgi:hypothetical protein